MSETPWDSGNFRSGTVIVDRYEVVDTIGMGGMGWVVKVRDRSLKNRIIALKLLYPHLLVNEVAFDRFRNEVLLSRELTHKNLVRIYDIGETEQGTHFISMEYVQGVTLQQRIEESDPSARLNFEQAVQVLYAIADGVAHAHEAEIIHRDLKPDNILISDMNEVKITDFGIARALWEDDKLTKTGQALGTPYYMAPEQIRSKEVDARTDVYALGIIAHELVAREKPFDDESFYNLADMHLNKKVPRLRSKGLIVPAWYEELIQTATQKKPEERFQSMSDVANLLQEKLESRDAMRVSTSALSKISPRRVPVPTSLRGVLRFTKSLLTILCASCIAYVVFMLVAIVLIRNNDQIGKHAIVPLLLVEKHFGIHSDMLDWYKRSVDFDVRADTPQDLIRAVNEERLQVFALTAAGIDGSVVDEYGNTALHLAVDKGEFGMAKDLYTPSLFGFEPIDPLKRNKQGETVIHILSKRFDSSDQAKRFSRAIREISHANRQKLIDRLFIDGRFLPDNRGNSPLHVAAHYDHELLTKYFLEVLTQRFPADVRTELAQSMVYQQNAVGRTPLHIAARNLSDSSFKVLMKFKTDRAIGALDEGDRTIMHFMLDRQIIGIQQQDKAKAILEMLLREEIGSEMLYEKDREGFTPIMYAVADSPSNLVRFMYKELRRNSEARAIEGLRVLGGASVITVAVRYQKKDTLRAILDGPLTEELLKHETQKGLNAFHFAVNRGNVDAVELMLSKVKLFGLLDAPDREGRTALFHAVEMGRHWIVQTLLKAGADPHVATEDGRTAFSIIPGDNVDEIQVLLAAYKK